MINTVYHLLVKDNKGSPGRGGLIRRGGLILSNTHLSFLSDDKDVLEASISLVNTSTVALKKKRTIEGTITHTNYKTVFPLCM